MRDMTLPRLIVTLFAGVALGLALVAVTNGEELPAPTNQAIELIPASVVVVEQPGHGIQVEADTGHGCRSPHCLCGPDCQCGPNCACGLRTPVRAVDCRVAVGGLIVARDVGCRAVTVVRGVACRTRNVVRVVLPPYRGRCCH